LIIAIVFFLFVLVLRCLVSLGFVVVVVALWFVLVFGLGLVGIVFGLVCGLEKSVHVSRDERANLRKLEFPILVGIQLLHHLPLQLGFCGKPRISDEDAICLVKDVEKAVQFVQFEVAVMVDVEGGKNRALEKFFLSAWIIEKG